MNVADPGFAPIGRLCEPLIELSARIQRALTTHRKTVWSDDRGSVFANDAFLLRSLAPQGIVGTYDSRTPQYVIERDLRIALRRRASQWIVDWDVPIPELVNDGRRHAPKNTHLRPRRRRRASTLDG